MDQQIMERVLLTGDLAGLNPDQRLHYYKSVCESLGLNPLTQPFGYITFEGRLQLYARKDATEQLRKIHNVSISDLITEQRDNVYIVTVKAQMGNGRTDMATGAVSTTYTTDSGTVKQYMGVGLANAIMKAETKAKRRVTLSICGLGLLDESEVEDLDQRPTDERLPMPTIQRNVEQATANAGAVVTEAKALTNGDLGDTVVHIGKAEGSMLGRKVKDLPDEVLAWLQHKWVEKLGPSASDQDYKLKKAVKHEIERREGVARTAQEASDTLKVSEDSTPAINGDSRTPTRAEMLEELRGRVDDMILTPKQFCGYLQLAGLDFHGSKLEELSDGQLTYLLKSWLETQKILQQAMKTPEAPGKPKPTRRKKGTGKVQGSLL